MNLFSKKNLAALSIFSVLFLFIIPSIFDYKIFLGGDNCNYYILANALNLGEGYSAVNLPTPVPANHFPPGYPFIMSLFMHLGIKTVTAFKIINSLFLLATTFVFYRLVYSVSKRQVLSIVLGVFVLFNAHMLEYSTIMMSEIPFTFLQLLSIYLLLLWSKKGLSIRSFYAAGFILCLILLIYTRTIGITMLGVSVLFLVFKKKFLSSFVVLSLTFLALLPWQIRSSNLGGSSYIKSMFRVETYDPTSPQMAASDWGERIKINAWRYATKEIPSSIFSNITVKYRNAKTGKWAESPTSHWALGLSIITLGLIGLLSIKENKWLFLLIFGSNFFIYMLWHQEGCFSSIQPF